MIRTNVPSSKLLPAILFGVIAIVAGPGFAQEGKPAQKPETTPPPAAETQPEADSFVYARMKTSLGDIVLELDMGKAPITVANFMKYAESEHYDGLIFHRVISNFMIQGGGFTAEMEKRETDAPIANEWQNGLKNELGTIAMARLGGRPDSATNQFFINVKDNYDLDTPRDGAGYAVFGRVIGGMDTVEAIRVVPTIDGVPVMGRPLGAPGLNNVPAEVVLIESVRPIEAAEAEELRGKDLIRTSDATPATKPSD